MKRIVLIALLAFCATPSLAVPTCDTPRGNIIVFEIGMGKIGEIERAHFYEQRLNMMGIPARNTTFWNGCIQAEVRTNGHNTLRYYDPWTLEEVPID
jgi:hypothetical protein